jgi:chromosome segregation ATPase
MKKDEIESLKSSLNKANEKIVSLQGDVEAYKLSGEQMGDEIKALKRQVGGYKTSNENYRAKLVDAQKVADGLKKEISDRDRAVSKQMDITKEKEKVIEGLQHQVSDLNQRIVNTDKALQDAKQDRDAYKANYEYFLSLPWYKRIFAK